MPSRLLRYGAGLLAVWLVSAAFSIQPAATPRPTPVPTRAPTPRPTPRPSATPTPIPPAITLGASTVIAGSPVAVDGSDFAGGRQVAIFFDVPDLPIGAADPDAQGAFHLDVVVPRTAPVGRHAVCAQLQPAPVCSPVDVLAPATPASAAVLPASPGDPPSAAAPRMDMPSPLALLAAVPIIALLAALTVLRRRRRLARALRPGQPWTPPPGHQ